MRDGAFVEHVETSNFHMKRKLEAACGGLGGIVLGLLKYLSVHTRDARRTPPDLAPRARVAKVDKLLAVYFLYAGRWLVHHSD